MIRAIRSYFLLFVLVVPATLPAAAQADFKDMSTVNSYADEQLPFLTNDGRTLIFTRGHHRQNAGGKADAGDIWYSQFSDSAGWSVPQRLPAVLNNQFYNGAFAYRANRLWVFGIYRNGAAPLPGVSVSTVLAWPQRWSPPQSMPVTYFRNLSANNGNCLSADGTIMILSLESFKSRGAEDLYVSFWQADQQKWSEPLNLGDDINTPLQELTPYLAPDNKTLFFASNGHGGFGSRDIFVAQRLDDSWTHWTAPRNLGAAINTEGAEMGYRYYPDLELAVYTSTKNSDGYGDIRLVDVKPEEMNAVLEDELVATPVAEKDTVKLVVQQPLPEENILQLKGKITDKTTGKAVLARVRIKDENGYVGEHFNDSTYAFTVPSKHNYVLQVDADGYVSRNLELQLVTNEAQVVVHDVALEPIKVGKTIKLENVLFKRGTAEFLPSSYDELDLVAEMMLNNPNMEIELAGHTDNVGVPQLNLRLSQDRVNAVIDYLVQKGVERSRLSGKGYGGSRPVASNATEATRRLNRRVEFTIVKQ